MAETETKIINIKDRNFKNKLKLIHVSTLENLTSIKLN